MLGVRITNYVCTREILRTLETCWDAESKSSSLSALQTPQVNVLLAGHTIVSTKKSNISSLIENL